MGSDLGQGWPGVSLDLTVSSVLVWSKLINSPAVCRSCFVTDIHIHYLLEIKKLLQSGVLLRTA